MSEPIELFTVVKELYNISGFRISVYDTDFNEIVAYPREHSPFCKLIKQNEKTKNSCCENDHKAFETVRRTNQVCLYKCSFGLYDAVAPLYSFGKLAGYMMMGQTLDTMDSSRSFAFNTASPFFTDKQQLSQAVSDTHIRAKENILSCLSIMSICAEYITLTNRLNMTKSDLSFEVKKHIDLNYSGKLTINQLCNHFFCSRSTVINSFKKKYGITINDYITSVRIDHAAELLLKTNGPIGSIAEQCGFSDQNYFSKVFLKSKGVSPGKYRKTGALV